MPHESERMTRMKRIDQQLKAAGWSVIHFSDVHDITKLSNHAVEEFHTFNGPVDYALVVEGKVLGVF